jgi:hypothetical protein
MPIVIREVVSEVILNPSTPDQDNSSTDRDIDVDQIVRLATERVLEHLRREWSG